MNKLQQIFSGILYDNHPNFDDGTTEKYYKYETKEEKEEMIFDLSVTRIRYYLTLDEIEKVRIALDKAKSGSEKAYKIFNELQ